MTSVVVGSELVFPVFGASGKGKDSQLEELCGTAFSIGPGIFMTAGHVLDSVFKHADQAIGYPAPEGGRWLGSSILPEHEILEHDIGIFRANEVPESGRFHWGDGASLMVLEGVQAVGFPHGLDMVVRAIVFRGFEGHIVSERRFDGVRGTPKVYELSFHCPTGFSGAPVIMKDEGYTVGVIVGNTKISMEVHTETEVTKEPAKETTTIYSQTLHLGIAVTAAEILAMNSKLLGQTVGGWLKGRDLLD